MICIDVSSVKHRSTSSFDFNIFRGKSILYWVASELFGERVFIHVRKQQQQ